MIYGTKLEELRLHKEENEHKILEKDIKESQKEFASLINVDYSVYGKYERENVIIPIKHLNTLCNHLNVSIDYIFNLTTLKKYTKYINDINKKIAGQRLKEFRNSLGNEWTQKKLAKKLGISYGIISGYERGVYLISTKILYKICSEYHISADYLLGKINNPKYLK